jgi:hypothetical protein
VDPAYLADLLPKRFEKLIPDPTAPPVEEEKKEEADEWNMPPW